LSKKVKILLIGLGLILAIFFLRGTIYRAYISYQSAGEKPLIKLSNDSLRSELDKLISNDMGINEISSIANSMTCDLLNFTSKKCDLDPNKLASSEKTNCIGYSSTFNSIANYLITKSGQDKKYKSIHHKGQLYLFGENIHNYFSSSFFKDHDFNQLIDLETGENITIDPSVSDYLLINEVQLKED
jgi:hypothetical protein